jgi:hypothetical protein
MKRNNCLHIGLFLGGSITLATIVSSCNQNQGNQYLTAKQVSRVKDSIILLTTHIANDVTGKGPESWINYFDNSPEFFMASGGSLAFKDYKTAVAFISDTLVKNVKHIKLKWGNIRTDVLSTDMASIGADFHEDITSADGKTNPIDGYFTGTALFNGKNWKLRNLHWSVKPSDNVK